MRCRTGGSIRNRNTAGTCNSYRLPAKTHKPIASVAALTAQPLAALPPYGCGVPFTGSERHWQLQILKQFRRPHPLLEGSGRPLPAERCRIVQAHVKTVMNPDLSLRGARRRGNLSRGLPRWTGHRRTCVLTDLTVAALPERHVRDNSTAGGRWCTAAPPDVSLCGARRRGALRAKREEVPLGCNLAVPGRITGKPRRIQGTK